MSLKTSIKNKEPVDRYLTQSTRHKCKTKNNLKLRLDMS